MVKHNRAQKHAVTPEISQAEAGLERSQHDADSRELLLRLLPVSASLAGLSIGAVTIFRLTDRGMRMVTFADDLLAICAMVFLLTTYLIFWALRSERLARTRFLAKIVDVMFLFALSVLVAVGFLLVYSLI